MWCNSHQTTVPYVLLPSLFLCLAVIDNQAFLNIPMMPDADLVTYICVGQQYKVP
jgi:hypothetical protein